MSKMSLITKGFVKDNPTFSLVLGMCPTLATTTSAMNGLEMGLATMFVLILSNMVISLVAPVVPDKVRIPVYIVIIATFVTVLQFLMQAFVPAVYETLGLFIPLIVVNCIVLGRAEAFANKNSVVDSALDGLGIGIFDFWRIMYWRTGLRSRIFMFHGGNFPSHFVGVDILVVILYKPLVHELLLALPQHYA